MSYTSRKTKPPRPRCRSFPFKSSRPSWFGKSGRPQNITNIQVFERVSEWKKVCRHRHLRGNTLQSSGFGGSFICFEFCKLMNGLSKNSNLGNFQKTNWCFIIPYSMTGTENTFSFASQKILLDHSYQFWAVQDTFQQIFVWKRFAGQNGIHHGLRDDSEIFWDLTAAFGVLPAGQKEWWNDWTRKRAPKR